MTKFYAVVSVSEVLKKVFLYIHTVTHQNTYNNDCNATHTVNNIYRFI